MLRLKAVLCSVVFFSLTLGFLADGAFAKTPSPNQRCYRSEGEQVCDVLPVGQSFADVPENCVQDKRGNQECDGAPIVSMNHSTIPDRNALAAIDQLAMMASSRAK